MAQVLSGRLRQLPAEALTAPDRYERNGWLRQGASNLLRLVRYLGGADPAKLAKGYAAPSPDPSASLRRN